MLTDPYDAHVDLVEAIAREDISPPDEWTALQDRLSAAIEAQSTIADRFTAAVLDGDTDPDDIAVLHALVLAEASADPMVVAAVNNALRRAVARRLRECYAPAAAHNYATLARRFDEAAAQLATAVETVDPEHPVPPWSPCPTSSEGPGPTPSSTHPR